MARITTRDCEQVVPNRFELVVLAAQRAHDLWNGAEPQVESGGEKPTVLALREIAARRIDPNVLCRELIERFMATASDAQPTIEQHLRGIGTSDLFPSEGSSERFDPHL